MARLSARSAALEDLGAAVRELARRLRDAQPELRVLFLSGYTFETMRDRGNLPPGSAFLEKPFDRVSLLRNVRDLLMAEGGTADTRRTPG